MACATSLLTPSLSHHLRGLIGAFQPMYPHSNHTPCMLTPNSVYPGKMDLGHRTAGSKKKVWGLLGKEFLGPVYPGYGLGLRCEWGGYVHSTPQAPYPRGRDEPEWSLLKVPAQSTLGLREEMTPQVAAAARCALGLLEAAPLPTLTPAIH